ncbi:hypothetical protein LTR84_000553 [Exophiala bonariae]|uniref:Beta-lactamase-related domain-containing protein n=1 Tax=Exophiala bonariae TaxID=1690606 RepID=A0AAV9NQX6_9EURO|nr:hypothetical protein LTR84_000553 [Exophiala bonariae]
MSASIDDFIYSARFCSLVDGITTEHHVPGLSIAIVQGQSVFSTGYGKACLENPTPCTADTLFDIASCAKSFTAAAVGLLVNDNDAYPEVQWETTMSSLLPDDFVMSGVGYTEAVTLEDILSHRSGMAAHNDSYMSHRAATPDNARSITRNLRNLSVAAPLRTRYLYCNMMYTVASYLVEVKSQKSFADFLHDRIFQPLGMQSTSLQPKLAMIKGHGDRIATGYYWGKDESTFHEVQSPNCEEGQGAGSIMASANDLIRWVKALINREDPITDRVYQGLVRGRSLKNPSAKRLKPFSSPAVYAAGLEVHYYRGHVIVGHDGSISGFTSRFFFMPDFKFGAVLLTNSSDAGSVTSILMRELMDQVLGVPEIERPQRTFKKAISAKSDTKPGMVRSIYQRKGVQNRSNGGKGSEKRYQGKEQPLEKSEHRDRSNRDQDTPLATYIGDYCNPGYHTLVVEAKGNQLFVDATDRSNGFTLNFEHVSDQTKYIAHLSDMIEGGDDAVEAEFVFEHGRIVKLGLQLEPALEDLIWFEKVL